MKGSRRTPATKPRCIGVLHIPKTAGSAIRLAFGQIEGFYVGPLYFDDEHFGTRALADAVPPPHSDAIATTSDLAEIVKTHRVIMGHYATRSLVGAGCDSIAMQVREPRCRILSLYRFWQSQSDEARSEQGPWGKVIAKADLPFQEFLASPEVWPAVDNLIVRQAMSYRRSHRWPWGHRSVPRRLYHDLRNRLSVVEWSFRSEEFIARICGELGVSSWPDLIIENATDVVGEEEVVDDATAQRLARLTHADRTFLDRLSAERVLTHRSDADLNSEFERTAARLGFHLAPTFSHVR